MRAQRDEIHLRSIRAIPPGTMRAQVTSPNQLPRGWGSGTACRVPGRVLDFPGTGRAEDGATDTTVDDRTRSCPNRADDHPTADTPTNSCTPDPLDAATSILNLGRRLR